MGDRRRKKPYKKRNGLHKRRGIYEFRKTIRGVRYYEQLPEAQTKLEAEVAVSDIIKKIYEGRYGKEGREIGATDFAEFCATVFLPDIKRRLKQWKQEEYKMRTLCRYFKRKRLKDITPMLVQRYRRERLTIPTQYGRIRQASTVKGELVTLSSIFNMAIDNELLGLNPCRKVKWAKGQATSRRERVLTEDEEVALFAELKAGEARSAAEIALNAGLRRMEVLGLNVAGINAMARTARVKGKGGKERLVPLNARAWAAVEELLTGLAPGGFLFRNRTGHNLSARDGAFQRAVRRAKIEDFHFHDLRHSFASRVRAVTDAFTVRDLLGHAEADTTDIYVNVRLEEMRRAVEALASGGRVLAFKTG